MTTRQRTTISLHKSLMAKARILMAERHFSDLASFLDDLIRTAWEKRQAAAAALNESPKPPSLSPPATSSPVNYRKPSATGSRGRKRQFPKG